MSLRGRLLTASLVLVACGLLVADAATYLALRSFLVDQVDRQLDQTANQVQRAIGPPASGHDVDDLRIAAPGVWVQVRDGTGKVVLTSTGQPFDASGSGPALPDPLPAAPQPASSANGGPPRPDPDESAPGQALPGTFVTVGSTTGGSGYRVRISQDRVTGGSVIVALSLAETDDTLQRLLVIEIIVTVAVLAASTAAGLWLVRVGLHPLDDISRTASEIAAGDLTRRVAREDDRTEIGRLGGSLNVMLGQIETAFSERQASEAALIRSQDQLRRFVADASHELRTPVAAIGAYAELFDRGAGQHPEDLPRLMQNIQKETARMSVLVDDLLLLTRLDQGRPLEQEPVDLGAIAAETADAARVVDPSRSVTLHVEGLVEVRGDRMRLRQVADNLVTNARKHTPADTPIEVLVGSHDDLGVLSVVDHGPGVPPGDTAKVFERFYRADPSRTRPVETSGSGLGLSIVAAIAAAHGGGADVVPTPGGGATFRVSIPLLTDAPADPPPAPDAPAEPPAPPADP